MMISVLHLLWIIPVSTIFGLFLSALFASNNKEDDK